MFKPKATAVKPLTTLLGAFFEKAGIDLASEAYNGKTIANPQPKLVGQYEAALTQASYLSRLAYEENEVKLGGIQLLNTNPLIFNTGIFYIYGALSKSGKASVNKVAKYVGEGSVISKRSESGGIFGKEAHCHFQVLDYTGYNCGCPYPGERVLYLAFRGTSSVKDVFVDLRANPSSLKRLYESCQFADVEPTIPTSANSSTSINSGLQVQPNIIRLKDTFWNHYDEKGFASHDGFIKVVELIMQEICDEVRRYLTTYQLDRIVITGHSLGAAKATLVAMILASFKSAGVQLLQPVRLHCITYGGPKLFLDYSRNVFNDLLIAGHLTLDRVANRSDNVASYALGSLGTGVGALTAVGTAGLGAAAALVNPIIDPIPQYPIAPFSFYVHPGFMILKTETHTQSTTGRSRNISDIRTMFGGLDRKRGYFFNGLPTYVEYFNCFDSVADLTYDTYKIKILINHLGRVYTGQVLKNIKTFVGSITNISAVADLRKNEPVVEGATGTEVAAVAAPAEPQEFEGAQLGGALFSRKETKSYKDETVNQGPNHVVYMCDRNISSVVCHAGYVGVAYVGALRTMMKSFKLAPYTKFETSGNTLVMTSREIPASFATSPAAFNATGGTRKMKRRHRHRSHRRRSHRRRSRRHCSRR